MEIAMKCDETLLPVRAFGTDCSMQVIGYSRVSDIFNLSVSESCELLITSLDQAPFDGQHIPTLFYLAETVLYAIRTNRSRQSRLTGFELRLLTIGRLAFARIYVHHVAGQLVAFGDLKSNLSNYVDGTASRCSVLLHSVTSTSVVNKDLTLKAKDQGQEQQQWRIYHHHDHLYFYHLRHHCHYCEFRFFCCGCNVILIYDVIDR